MTQAAVSASVGMYATWKQLYAWLSTQVLTVLQGQLQEQRNLQEVETLTQALSLPSLASVCELTQGGHIPSSVTHRWEAFPGTDAHTVDKEEEICMQQHMQQGPHLMQLPQQFQV